MTAEKIAELAVKLNDYLINSEEVFGDISLLDVIAILTTLKLAVLKRLKVESNANIFNVYAENESEQMAFYMHLENTLVNNPTNPAQNNE
jgi:hypothetical protein